MGNEWKKIWEKKEQVLIRDDENEFEAFCRLKKANGYDVAVEDQKNYYMSFYNEWLSLYDNIIRKTGNITSVYEVGCGSGVNIYMFKNRGVSGGGIDYSPNLLNTARQFGDPDRFTVGEASEITEEPHYSLVMSEGVFEYFNSLDYAEVVLKKMLAKSTCMVYLGGVWNKEQENELMEYRRNTIENYDEKYKGLDKQFYSKDWICSLAADYGKNVEFEPINNKYYWNAKYLFNCFIY